MSAPVVICIDRESYIAAVVALDETIRSLADGSPTKLKLQTAHQDLERAYVQFQMVETHIHTPALIKRQAG